MSPDQRARALRLADALDSPESNDVWIASTEAANLLRELAAERVRVPLTDEQVAVLVSAFYSDADHAEMMFEADLEKCRAVERAHGIGDTHE